ncbi:MAG TPA: phosphoribosylamine--glycine ligase [Candidatus Marinimicrobia bacterium]|nr:phosphoribosylamine--glycine ligase [Candidatus Neomarinimicrobiota bacterium]
MKVLVIGSGGRESTLVWKLAQAEEVTELYCAPGNAGTACYAENVEIPESEFDQLIEFVGEKEIDLTVVGPEQPLVDGIVDRFVSHNLKIFGPTQNAARLEGSKVFAKQLMSEYDIRTAPYVICEDRTGLEEVTNSKPFPYVIKVDGLAAGKGALVIRNEEDLAGAVFAIYEENRFGDAAKAVLVEEFLEGEELSLFALTDGNDYILLPPAQDHKRIFDYDEGPNTGGMGAYAPAPLGTPEIIKKAEERIIRPVLKGMQERGMPYRGVLYCGLIIHEGEPWVVEFNARFGDPETQVVVPLIKSGFADVLLSIAEGHLKKERFELSDRYAACVILASKGYPGVYEKGKVITGIEELYKSSKAIPFLAGVKHDGTHYLTTGGRVLGVTVISNSLNDAVYSAYNYVQIINFDGKHYRTDIGMRALKKGRFSESESMSAR